MTRHQALFTPRRRPCSLWSAIVLAAVLGLSCLASAEEKTAAVKSFDIPADAADKSFKRFSAQSGLEIAFGTATSTHVRTNAVKGNFAPGEAMALLLAGTGLAAEADPKTGAWTIFRDPNVQRAAQAISSGRPTPRDSEPAQESDADVVHELSPFEVITEKDYGYTATNTLSGGRLSTDLQHTPAAISVMTREFLDDLGISDVQGALQWAANSVAAGDSDVAGDATISNNLNGQPQMFNNANSVSIRGFNSTIARNYFPWFINSDSYNTERIDISRGPNAMLFGDGAAGGVVNVSTKRASFGSDFYRVQARMNSDAGHRITFDVNKSVNKAVAFRINALRDRTENWRDFFKLERDGVAGAMTIDLGRTAQIRAESEWGLVDRRSPALYMRDRASAWNGTYALASRLTGTQAPPSGAGVLRVDTGSNANRPFNVMDLARPELGFLDWQGSVRTNGLGVSLEQTLPEHIASTGLHTAVPVDAPAVLGRREFRLLPDYGYAANVSAFRGRNEYQSHSLFMEKRIGDRFFIEAAGAFQKQDAENYTPATHNAVYIDVNEFLPAGVIIDGSDRNPNFLRPYVESATTFDIRGFDLGDEIAEGRISAVYLMDTRLTRQRFGVVYTQRKQENKRVVGDFRRINGEDPNTAARGNQLFFRTYLHDGRHLSQEQYRINRGPYDLPGGVVGEFATIGTPALTTTSSESLQAFASGSWLEDDRVTTLVGVRRDSVRTTRTHYFDGTTLNDTKGTVDSPSIGIVVDTLPGLSLYGSASRTFIATPGGLAFSFQGESLPLPRGEGYDVGLKFNLLDGRISGSLGYYKSEETNASRSRQDIGSRINQIRSLMGLADGNTFSIFNDTQDATATGYELDVTANLTRAWSLSANFSLPDSILSNSLPRFRTYLDENRPSWEAYAADSANDNAAQVRERLDVIDIILARNADGLPRVNQHDYIANLFTRYRINKGVFKGLAFGGGIRMVGSRLMALRDGVPPDYSSGYHTVDALLSYQRRWKNVTTNFQLNVSNVFDAENFRYTSLLANGTPQLYRISDPRRFTFTTTFKL